MEAEAQYWRHVAYAGDNLSDELPASGNNMDAQQSQEQVTSSSSSGTDSTSVGSESAALVGERLYDLRAPGQLVAVYLVYCVPLLVVGAAGWMFQHWPASSRHRALLTSHHLTCYPCSSHACSASRNVLLVSNRDAENGPEYSEFLYLCENHRKHAFLEMRRSLSQEVGRTAARI